MGSRWRGEILINMGLLKLCWLILVRMSGLKIKGMCRMDQKSFLMLGGKSWEGLRWKLNLS
ncbi:hypothetical protein, partial [Siminovitchia fortis]|uniref:hypothetical protein n=1 Tax=Siminovitchia fortis TaxID=254758 RepID=UPI001C92E287